MNEEEIKEMYKELKRNKKIIGSIDKDFFFEFAETVLNLLEKKDTLINTMQSEFERLENLEDNTDMLKMELEKKNKIINEMAQYLASIDFDEHCVEVPGICISCPKEDDLDGYMQCIKQYFERR